jgi:probable phosphoglycerate mutase
MTTFFIVRHASNDSVGKHLAGRMPGIHLNHEGLRQADELAKRLKHVPLRAIYSSPLERTIETANAIAQTRGLDVKTCDGISEIDYGEWTGCEIEALVEERRWKHYNSFRSGTRIPAGELMLESQTRTVLELERLSLLYPKENLLIVTHGDIIRGAIAYYAGIPLDLAHRIEIACASISVIEINDHGPRILQVNITGEWV